MRLRPLSAIALVLAVGLAGCTASSDTEEPTTGASPSATADSEATEEVDPDASGATDAGIDLDKVRDMMLAHPGVAKVHDLHIWALGSKEPVLTAHIILTDETQPPDAVRESLAAALTEAFDIVHATLQVDASTLVEGSVHA